MVLVRFVYHVRGIRKPRHVRKPSSVSEGMFGAKSLRDESQDICKDTASNLGPFAGSVLRLKLFRSKLYFSFRAEQHAKNNYELIMQSALFYLFIFFFLARRGHFFV